MAQGSAGNHKELRVWQLAMDLAVEVYRESGRLPASEAYGLVSQLRRSAASIPANIAEGAGRDSTAEFLRFLSIASGSLAELETHLLLCERLAHLAHSESVHRKIRGVRLMLGALRTSLRKRRG